MVKKLVKKHTDIYFHIKKCNIKYIIYNLTTVPILLYILCCNIKVVNIVDGGWQWWSVGYAFSVVIVMCVIALGIFGQRFILSSDN